MGYAIKAIGSRINISESEHKISRLYYDTVCDLLDSPEVIRLDEHKQHLNTSRLSHSINVSFYSFRLARFFRLNARAAARAGLLHDMYYYDFKASSFSCSHHSRLHPQLALLNAMKITNLNEIEEDIILSHMWPMTKHAPKNAEGYIVTLTDKFCTLMEVVSKIFSGFAV